jgi:hypothetical protein
LLFVQHGEQERPDFRSGGVGRGDLREFAGGCGQHPEFKKAMGVGEAARS